MAPSSPARRQSRVSLPPELPNVFYSAALRGGDPTAARAERHYVVWHLGACHRHSEPTVVQMG